MTGRAEALVAVVDEALIIIAFLLLGIYVARTVGVIDVGTALAIASGVGGFIAIIAYLIIKTHAKKPEVGPEALVGVVGQVIEDLNPEGTILVEGEIWRARSGSGERIPRGSAVRVVGVDGLTLIVEPYSSGEASSVE